MNQNSNKQTRRKILKISKSKFPKIFNKNKEIVSSGKKPSINGKKYEIEIFNNCNKLRYINGGKFIQDLESDLGGSSVKNDLLCTYTHLNKIFKTGIEIKNNLNAEMGQQSIVFSNNRWIAKSKKNPEMVNKLFENIVNIEKNNTNNINILNDPPKLKEYKNRKEFDDWQEMHLSKIKAQNPESKKKSADYCWEILNTKFISEIYKYKGNSYIQIKNYGLYHLGVDICNLGVPEFKPETIRIRIRCKRRGKKGCIPSSITVSAYAKGLKKSDFSLDNLDKIPKNLTIIKDNNF